MLLSRKKRRLRAGLFVLALTALIAVIVICAFPAWEYAHADSIERVEIDTQRELTNYERTQNAAPLREWLDKQDGAFSTAASYTLADWAVRHPDAFIAFLNTMDAPHFAAFAEDFGFVVGDTGRDKAFRQAFQGNPSPRVAALLHALPNLVPWVKP